MDDRCIIIGAGHAGSQAAVSLRQEGYAGQIILINDETDIPYHKPPLSKSYLKAPEGGGLVLRPESAYRDNNIEMMFGRRVDAVSLAGKTVRLDDGQVLNWSELIFATGARARIPDVPGVELDGVFTLRRMEDARRIAAAMPNVENVVIIGGGFIGLEMAHSAIALGKKTVLIEAAPRVLGRSVATHISAHVEARSRAASITVLTGLGVMAIEGENGRVTGVKAADGTIFPADMVVMGTGAMPNVELAVTAGLAVDNGIVVDENLRTSASHVYAIGDCVSYDHFHAGRRVRLESVQNATDQAKHVARTIVGRETPFREIAWFWSDQGDMKLQTAGLSFDADRHVLSGNPEENAFSIFHFAGDRLVAVDSINRPADHMIARRLLAAGINPTEADIAAGAARLKEMLAAAPKA
ncbi:MULTISPECIES: NAD(P)/FAD-dependent oxidoreductase [Brucella/Ochrobactrum group]|jgi:3-phenylpropionate/trans-cinnamate dioxygenase ferredoxin reductase subunit|uniref:NAD(P)/FAD-dependent oxidoreductase n=1 Tax=Brucella pseudintermedia TaxID=370111 RepID=A0ABY5UFJ4_9HYPH|nr:MULTISPECIES: FAD/NAD(P)-binding oxidoreductase [Brucella/Ochrobactrum group]KAB2684635.1 NAD(P)/FAD-dependent oxidoreductase [Brucella pseudintermedia]NKE74659.1 NAD(P)/FAD-dependent oxidoreductase [Ochrobactrum sp. MC-1LL]TWG97587.1 3-phenylpropionate/trans-cinnamate dioxygenase ferredoxin reductase subunit [Ochrobactrum sp. J50]UWL62088.1 NAD(P)/FAD-dependent oxidoreductase [Brucella pseudintermedia]WPM82560.1 FAD/NAD(P)-binding oxidoreductase [Brucella pseudintermedia]